MWALADAELNAYVGSAGKVGLPWPHVQQILRLRRERRVKGRVSVKITYAVTSVGPERAEAREFLAMTRNYWGIENRLHWVRDVSLGEDLSQVRSGSAPQVLAALRNLMLCLLRRAGWKNIASSLRTLGARPRDAIALVLTAGQS